LPKSNKEAVDRLQKRVEDNDPIAIYNRGNYYRKGENGYPKDNKKALELWDRAGELGSTAAYNAIGYLYEYGEGVEVDEKKAVHYFELAAMQGDSTARYNLGEMEEKAGNMERALKHYMIAVKDGNNDSLQIIQQLYSNGHASREDYKRALQSYQEYLGEIKSAQRDKAAAADDQYRYY